MTYARRRAASPETVGREYAALWEAALRASGLPVLEAAPGRPKIVFGAPLPAGISGERELLDLWLVGARVAWQVRERLEAVLPPGHEFVGLENVWLGAPALPGRVVGAEYLVTLANPVDPARLRQASAEMCALGTITRKRVKADGVRTYDLRPLVRDVTVLDGISPTGVRIATRSVPQLGTGRPDEVLAALAVIAGIELQPKTIVRDRLVLAGDEA